MIICGLSTFFIHFDTGDEIFYFYKANHAGILLNQGSFDISCFPTGLYKLTPYFLPFQELSLMLVDEDGTVGKGVSLLV